MYTCPKNHDSTEADFCSECGAKMLGLGISELKSNPTNSTSIPAATRSVSVQACPDCTTPHEADTGSFCEICGYNFLTSAKGGNPLVNFPPPANLSPNLTTAPIASGKPIGQWQLIISIDPTLATPDSPTAPTQAPMTIELKASANLIGRTSQSRAIYPEIPLDFDDAVSSRHAILTLHPDGSLVLRDIGSSNGTMVNGREIAVMADVSIESSDEITLGHWTSIKIK